jgi:hypothetical protein
LLESERQGSRVSEPVEVTATYIRSIDDTVSVRVGMITVEDKIYVPHYSRPYRIDVYENENNFHFIRSIPLNIEWPYGIVYSNKSKCVYIADRSCCIWMMPTTGEHRLTKWLIGLTSPYRISLSNEGNLLLLRGNNYSSPSQLEIYSLNATLIRRIQLAPEIKTPNQVVQTPGGNFIILHTLNNKITGPWVISQLTSDGQLLNHQFIPTNQTDYLSGSIHYISLANNNRLFVADSQNDRVIVLNANDLTWSQILKVEGRKEIRDPFTIYFDADKKHLFVLENHRNATIFKINFNLC